MSWIVLAGAAIRTPQRREQAVMDADQFPSFPVAFFVAGTAPNVVGHIDTERAEDVGAQRRAAPVHAKHNHDGPLAGYRVPDDFICRHGVAPSKGTCLSHPFAKPTFVLLRAMRLCDAVSETGDLPSCQFASSAIRRNGMLPKRLLRRRPD